MKHPVLWIIGAGLFLVLFGGLLDPEDHLIWNRTGSAPEGLYWRSNDPFTPGRWVIVSASSADAQWAEEQGFVGNDWPLVKRIAGIAGDEICRHGQTISINDDTVASAHLVDSSGRKLPYWQGCVRLSETEVFLLNAHPESLDGRYFGLTKLDDLDGVAIPLFTLKD
jgi:conjugative transfer signal peptidase TraF